MVEATVIRTIRTSMLFGSYAARSITAYLTSISGDPTSGIVRATVVHTVAPLITMSVTASAADVDAAETLALQTMQAAVDSASLAITVA